MKQNSLRYPVLLAVMLVLIFIVGAAVSVAQDGTKVAGTITAAFTDRTDIEIGDMPGHIFSCAASEGTNKSTGENAFMDGAKAMNYSAGDLVNGNGNQNGYVKMMMGDDGAIAKWEHTITTTMGEGDQPMSTFKGTFTWTGGMGKYAGIKGKGTFEGKFTSPTEYTVDWQGEYTIPMK
jgi:hypothetical protein